MYYETLPPVIQSIVMLNIEFVIKLLIIFIGLSASFYYLNIKHEKQEATGYLLKSMSRVFLYFITKVYIYISPLLVLLLFPQVSTEPLLNFLIVFYYCFMIVFFVIFMVNAFYLAPLLVLKVGGYEPQLRKYIGAKKYNFITNVAFQKWNKTFDKYLKKFKNED